MLESRKTAVALDEEDMVELQRIIIDGDENGALRFLKKVIFNRIAKSQSGRLKCHLDSAGQNPVENFKAGR